MPEGLHEPLRPAGMHGMASRKRNRFTNTGLSYPSKYRPTYPWPHSCVPAHRGHCKRDGQGYDEPFSIKSFTLTG